MLFNCVRLVGKCAFFLAKLILAILMLISRKLVQKGIGKKGSFFATRRPSPMGYMGVTIHIPCDSIRLSFDFDYFDSIM